MTVSRYCWPEFTILEWCPPNGPKNDSDMVSLGRWGAGEPRARASCAGEHFSETGGLDQLRRITQAGFWSLSPMLFAITHHPAPVIILGWFL